MDQSVTCDVARISLSVDAIDVDRDRHLRVRYVDRAARILVRRPERYPQSGHSLVHQQEVCLVFRSRFTVAPISGVTFVAYASELIAASCHAGSIRRAKGRVVSTGQLRQTRESVTVIALKVELLVVTFHSDDPSLLDICCMRIFRYLNFPLSRCPAITSPTLIPLTFTASDIALSLSSFKRMPKLLSRLPIILVVPFENQKLIIRI